MTWGEFRRWVREMEPLEAEDMLRAVQVQAVPNLSREDAREWFDRQIARTWSTTPKAEVPHEDVTWNGKVLSIFEFKQAVRRGFQAA